MHTFQALCPQSSTANHIQALEISGWEEKIELLSRSSQMGITFNFNNGNSNGSYLVLSAPELQLSFPFLFYVLKII